MSMADEFFAQKFVTIYIKLKLNLSYDLDITHEKLPLKNTQGLI